VDLTVDNGASATAVVAELHGDVKAANVVVAGTADSVTVSGIAALTTLTLSGAGSATVNVAGADKLATVDASDLGGKLAYTSSATGAETIILGDGADVITLNASIAGPVVGGALTFTTMDTIENFDVASDDLTIGATGFAVITITGATSATDAINQAAQHATANVVFTYGGDAYVLVDGNTTDVLDAADVLVKLVGISDTADLNALAALI
jgi:hypothetical protein